MPSLLAEDALHGTRKPCSRTLKALFLHQARPFDEKRGAWQLKYLDNPYWMFSVLLIQRVRSISHRKTQMNRTHRGQKNSGPSPAGRGVICEVTPTGLPLGVVGSFFSHRTHRLNRTFLPTFQTHRTPPVYRYHRTLLPKVGVGWWVLGADD